jgi:hypothetical protein
MIRFAVRLAVAAFVANAAYRIGSEYFAHVKFRGAVRSTVVLTAKTDNELRQRIMALAAEHDVPLAEDHLAIRRDSHHVFVQGSYKKPIDLLPLYEYPWRFEMSIEAPTPPPSTETPRAR